MKKPSKEDIATVDAAFEFIAITAKSAGDTVSYNEAVLIIGGRIAYIAQTLRAKNIK